MRVSFFGRDYIAQRTRRLLRVNGRRKKTNKEVYCEILDVNLKVSDRNLKLKPG